MRRQLLAAGALLGALLACVFVGARPANADPVNVIGTATFQDTGEGNNGLNLTAPASPINLNLTVGTPDMVSDFITISTTDSNNSKTVSDTIMETFTFTLPGTGSGTASGTGSETTFLGFESDGTITWSAIDPIQFSDGAELQISLSNTSF